MSDEKFLDSLFSFLGDSDGLTQEEVCSELKELGIDTQKLKERVKKIIKEHREKCYECGKPIHGLSKQDKGTKKSWKFYCNDCFKIILKES
jgi:hypothetical protein